MSRLDRCLLRSSKLLQTLATGEFFVTHLAIRKASTLSLFPSSLNTSLSSLDSSIASIRTRFLADYTALMSSSNVFDSCALCSSIKPHGTLDTIRQSQFPFLSSQQVNVCTLCYYNLMDQFKSKNNNISSTRIAMLSLSSSCSFCSMGNKTFRNRIFTISSSTL